jgi:hypothetical protein
MAEDKPKPRREVESGRTPGRGKMETRGRTPFGVTPPPRRVTPTPPPPPPPPRKTK